MGGPLADGFVVDVPVVDVAPVPVLHDAPATAPATSAEASSAGSAFERRVDRRTFRMLLGRHFCSTQAPNLGQSTVEALYARAVRGAARTVALLVSALAATAAYEARADDGPVYALGRMMDASPTLTIVTSGVVILADAGFTTIDGIAATKRQELGLGLSALEVTLATPQALGFAMAPFFFDISRWDTGETIGLLIPFQAWSAALATHGIWSLAPDAVEQPGRVGASFLVGLNWAFTTTGIGCLSSWGKPAPMGVAALEIGFMASEAALTIERAVDDPDHAGEWGGLATWSLFMLAHGIGSAVISAKKSDSYDYESAAGVGKRRGWMAMPSFTVKDGAYTLGAVGQF